MSIVNIIHGDSSIVLPDLIASSVKPKCVVTSPMYWGFRAAAQSGVIGLEPTLGEYVDNLVSVFSLCKDFLEDRGTMWLVLGDALAGEDSGGGKSLPSGIGPNDFIGGPQAVVQGMVNDGWILQRDYQWKIPQLEPNRDYEHVYMFSQNEDFYFTETKPEAIWEIDPDEGGIVPTFPPALVLPCVMSSTVEGDTVCDPFSGMGTVGLIAQRYNRHFIGIDINRWCIELSRDRIEANRDSLDPHG